MTTEETIPIRCDECGATVHLTPREESRLPAGPFTCSTRCEDTAALREQGARDEDAARREYDRDDAFPPLLVCGNCGHRTNDDLDDCPRCGAYFGDRGSEERSQVAEPDPIPDDDLLPLEATR